MTNRLIESTSPYLLQHADNPVEWYPWGEEALEKALGGDKPIIVSIGYSSCHWCHVMAHESFEDSATAAIMNEHFVNIKVDREERPDIDQIYMDAVHKMGLNGGWPLNVFLTPDQKPFYGGTYFPKDNWQKLLLGVSDAFKKNRQKIEESADQFASAIDASELAQYGITQAEFKFEKDLMDSMYANMEKRFDPIYGGMDKAPKFPMPSIWELLFLYADHSKDQGAMDHLLFTLDRIADGGIYDQIGGGFSRYSVDKEWHVPHFEKMLYDNGQLLSVYAQAYKMTGKESYKTILEETIEWMEREMLDDSGGFYAALDADSEGEEGKFYVWSIEEIEKLAGDHAGLIKGYYDVTANGNWEEGKNVLRRQMTDEDVSKFSDLDMSDWKDVLKNFKSNALQERSNRIRPGLDSKLIAGWNGLALSGICHAYQATQDTNFLDLAKGNAAFLKSMIVDGKLRRIPSSDLEAFMEDYAAVIRGLLDFYQTTFDIESLELADELTKRVMESFYDEEEGFFYFTGDKSEALIARKKEIFDNVIPASNSIMARNLFYLGTLTYNDNYIALAKDMVSSMIRLIPQDPAYLSNWACLAMEMSKDFPEIVILGPDYQEYADDFNRRYLPSKVIAGAANENESAMFEYKSMKDGKTTIFVCFNRNCKLPVTSVEEALKQLN